MRFPPTIQSGNFNELVRPKLRLFLSVDVVGSSDLKYQGTPGDTMSGGPVPEWVFLFQSFYVEFPKLLRTSLPIPLLQSKPLSTKASTPQKRAKSARLTLWKALGDELIFVVELRKRSDAALYLEAFCTAMQKASDNWQRRWRLQFKGTAWLAGFPLINAEIPVMDDRGSLALVPDFLGPQIDTGFRLKEHSTPRKLVLSAELAYLLARSPDACPPLYFDGDQPLKGILRGKPYPLIWMDSERLRQDKTLSLNQKKDRLLKRLPAKHQDMVDYLGHWLDEAGGQVVRPFIQGDLYEDLRPPASYQALLKAWIPQLRAQFMEEPKREPTTDGKDVPPTLGQFLKD